MPVCYPNVTDLDMIDLYDPEVDAWGYIGKKIWQ